MIFGSLAQVTPAASTLEDAYTVPADKRATVQTIICNRGANATIRVAHAVGGEADSAKQYLLYEFPLSTGDTQSTAKLTMAAGDILRVFASTGDVAFNINGIEEDV